MSKGGDRILTRVSLRWSLCDSPLHKEGEGLLPKSDLLRTRGPDPYDYTVEAEEAIALVFDVSVDVLQQLDSENIFGGDLERSKLALGIWMGDQSDEDRIAYARRLNPSSIVQQVSKELAEGYDEFTRLSQQKWR